MRFVRFIKETESVGSFNAASSGSIDGIGSGPNGEPGVHLRKKRKKLKTILSKNPLKRIMPS
jgi:hypothetical protein